MDRFESNMSIHKHAFYNNHLNTLVSDTVKYKHTYITDTFFNSPTPPHDNTLQRNRFSRLRVSRDTRTGHLIQVCEKQRVLDIDVYQASGIGFRVSVNTETPVDERSIVGQEIQGRLAGVGVSGSGGGSSVGGRVKDRMSYFNQCNPFSH